jgi:hypothetical protein
LQQVDPDFSIILTKLSLVYGFGNNSHGQIGIESNGLDLLVPTQIRSLYGFPLINIAAENSYSLVLTITGLVLGTRDHSIDQLRISSSKVSEFTILNFLSRNHIVHLVAFGDLSGAIGEFGLIHIWRGVFKTKLSILQINFDENYFDLVIGSNGRYVPLLNQN